jgi:hypothetical protein
MGCHPSSSALYHARGTGDSVTHSGGQMTDKRRSLIKRERTTFCQGALYQCRCGSLFTANPFTMKTATNLKFFLG